MIDQLETPVLVFNPKLQLTHANGAFNAWYGQPWQAVRGFSCTRLGFIYSESKQWQFINKQAHTGWQIKASLFLDGRDDYQLIILNNIEQEVRETQQEAWQQIIRGLSHEIRNSLTPIKSLAQSLLAMKEINPKPKQALQVIHDRSYALQEFVNSYATITKSFKLNLSSFSSQAIVADVVALLSEVEMDIQVAEFEICADRVLLEQVLINLVKNAHDAIKQKDEEINESEADESPRNKTNKQI